MLTIQVVQPVHRWNSLMHQDADLCAPHSTDQGLTTPSASHLEGVVNDHANGESTNAIPGGKGCLDISLHTQPKGFNTHGSHACGPLVIQKRQAADKYVTRQRCSSVSL